MAIRPKKAIQKRNDDALTDGQEQFLLFGHAFFDDEPFASEEECRQAWFKHREQFIASARFERCWAWWRYEAPAPRKFISCSNDFCPYFPECPVAKGIPTEAPQCVIRVGEDRKGKSSFDGWLKIECVGHDFKIYEPIRESQKEYLMRLNLLTAKEQELLENMERA